MDPDLTLFQRDISNDVVFTNCPARYTYTRTPNVNPALQALAAEGASAVDKTEFRMCGEDGAWGTPLRTRPTEREKSLGDGSPPPVLVNGPWQPARAP